MITYLKALHYSRDLKYIQVNWISLDWHNEFASERGCTEIIQIILKLIEPVWSGVGKNSCELTILNGTDNFSSVELLFYLPHESLFSQMPSGQYISLSENEKSSPGSVFHCVSHILLRHYLHYIILYMHTHEHISLLFQSVKYNISVHIFANLMLLLLSETNKIHTHTDSISSWNLALVASLYPKSLSIQSQIYPKRF